MDAVRDQMETKAFDNWEAAKTFLHGLSHRYIYRGEGNLEWDPKPSLERACPGGSAAQAESALISAFRGAAHLYESNLPATDDDLSWLALMQHHGVPTRLLDWTRSPYVAAFFAADHSPDQPCQFVIWAMDTLWLKQAAITKLSTTEGPEYLPLDAHLGTPSDFSRHFLENRVTFVAPVQPTRVNSRQTNQKGLFLCTGDVGKPFALNLVNTRLANMPPYWGYRVVLPDATRKDVLRDLNRLNVNHATLFPGLDGFSQALSLQLRLQQERFGDLQWRLEVAPMLGEFGFL